MCQNRTFGAGFLAITSNARHAERSNDRCPVLPTGPGLLARRLPRGIADMIVGPPWHNLRSSSVAFGLLPFSNACPGLGVVNPVLAVGAVLWDELPRRVPRTFEALTKLVGQPRTLHK
jgi:hypothetical protein